LAVSYPDSPLYGHYLTLAQIRDLVAPQDEVVELVKGWITQFSPLELTTTYTRDYITAKVPVRVAEEMLQVDYLQFQHKNGAKLIRTLEAYSVPSHIHKHLDLIGGTIRFPRIKSLKVTPLDSLQDPLQAITPPVIKSLLNISDTGKDPSNIQAVAQFLDQYYDPNDLQKFQTMYKLPVQKVDQVIGPNNPNNPGLEASLDIEYIMGVSNNIKTWFFYTAGLHEAQEPFLEWATALNNMASVPFVMSVSYGDTESSVTEDYANRCETEFQKLGNRGISVLFASGDDGVGCNSACTKQEPNWPASSQYVTTVGGVTRSNNEFVGDYISSGGFSNYFPMPAYQESYVQKYLATVPLLPPSTFYNKTGRAMPDLSSFSELVTIVSRGSTQFVGGTSCAAPVVAGMLGLINDIRLQQSKSTLGFINPALYSKIYPNHPNAFYDVTKGVNGGGGCCSGFSCANGWDPVTGFGVPNYINFRDALLSL